LSTDESASVSNWVRTVIKPRNQVSPVALDLVKQFEGYRQAAIQLPDGRWTIGYGHTKTARQAAEVSEDDAEALLSYDLAAVAAVINGAVYTPLTQNQFDALVSFVFNIGPSNFERSSVLRRINEGAMLDAAFALEIWRKADFEGERIVVDALVRRRAAEKALFLTPTGGWVPAPSAMVEPKADHGFAATAPELPAAESAMPLEEMLGGRSQPEDDALSPSQRAAAALSVRLQALVPEGPAIPPVEPAAEPRPATEPEPFGKPEPLAKTPPPSRQAEPAPQLDLRRRPTSRRAPRRFAAASSAFPNPHRNQRAGFVGRWCCWRRPASWSFSGRCSGRFTPSRSTGR